VVIMQGPPDFRNQPTELTCIARDAASGSYRVNYSSPPCFLNHHFKGQEIFPIFIQLQWITTLAFQCFDYDGSIRFQRVRCKNSVTFPGPIVVSYVKQASRLTFSIESNNVISTTGSLFMD
jgi:hypothetical protein